MPALVLNGWAIPVSEADQSEVEVGFSQRAFSGKQRRSRRANKRQWTISTAPMLFTDAAALEYMLLSRGEQIQGEVDAYTAKGVPPVQDNGISSIIGAGQYGNALWAKGVSTNLFPTNISTGTDTNGDITGFVACAGTSYGDTTAGSTLTSSTTYAWQGSRSLFMQAGSGNFFSVRTTSITVSPSTTYTFSCYVRGTAGGDVAFGISAADQNNASVGNTGRVTGYHTGWLRFTMTFTTRSTSSAVQFFLEEYVDAGYQWYMDGFQLELGSTASPWVAATTPGVNLAYDVSAHTKLTDALTVSFWARVPTNGGRFFAISDAALNFPVLMRFSGTADIYLDGQGGVQLYTTWASTAIYTHFAVVMTPAATTIYANGVAVTSGASVLGGLPLSTFTRLWFGNYNGANQFGGYIDELMFLPYEASASLIAGLYSLPTTPATQPAILTTGEIVGNQFTTTIASDVKATFLGASKGGTFNTNMGKVSFTLSEV